MLSKYFELIRVKFRIESLDKFTVVTKRVIAYNQKVDEYNDCFSQDYKHRKSKIKETHNNSILLLLQQYSFDQLVENNIIPRRTKYKYIKTLEKIGLSKNHLAIDTVNIEKSEDFEEYNKSMTMKYQ